MLQNPGEFFRKKQKCLEFFKYEYKDRVDLRQ